MINADVHSGEDVILIAVGPGSDRVRGQMDNTEVFRVIAEALARTLLAAKAAFIESLVEHFRRAPPRSGTIGFART
jgi:hypothetical protein